MSQQYQSNTQHQQHFQPPIGNRYPPGSPQEQRREFLWRERVRLELQMQGLIAHAANLAQQWQHLQARKTAFRNQTPKVGGQIIFSGLAGIHQLPAERMYQYEKDRIAQEEYRIQQDMVRCNGDAAAIRAQIGVIDFELSLL